MYDNEPDKRKDDDGLASARNVGWAALAHAAAFGAIFAAGALLNRAPEAVIPIDMTIVPPWAEQTDDPEPDPNPPPKPEEAKSDPKPAPEPEAEKPPERKVEAVEQVKEKPKKKAEPKKKPKPKEKPDFRKNAKLKTVEKPDFRKNAKKVEAPDTMRRGKGTARDKPLTPEEFARRMNEGYRVGASNQLAGSEEQRCISLIANAIRREWDKESFKWHPGLAPLEVTLTLGPGGAVRGWKIVKGSGDGEVDRTARNALGRLRAVPGLSAGFLEKFATLTVSMKPTGAR